MAQLVFVHGRGQEKKDAVNIKKEWLKALDVGLRKSNLTLPVAEVDVRLPFYGKTLFDLTEGVSPEKVAEVIIRGAEDDAKERAFMISVLREVQKKAGITDEQIEALTEGDEPIEKGILNNRLVLGILRGCRPVRPRGQRRGHRRGDEGRLRLYQRPDREEKDQQGRAGGHKAGRPDGGGCPLPGHGRRVHAC